jgi:hypothetical protein
MQPGPFAFALVVSVLALGCHPAAGTRAPAPASPPVIAATPLPTVPAPLVMPATLPPVPPEPPAPTAALPPGTPESAGSLSHLLAIDDQRAIVRFFVPGPDHAKRWWVALMHRDGSLGWVQTLAGEVAMMEGSSGIEIVGDSVSLLLSEFRGDEPQLSLVVLALSDGQRRFDAELGQGFAVASTTHDGLRFDVRLDYGSAGQGTTAELVASSSKRVVWRAKIPAPPPPGPDPTIVGDVIAVRGDARRGGGARGWCSTARAASGSAS